MRATGIVAHEARFDATGLNSGRRRHLLLEKSIQIPGEQPKRYLDYIGAGLADGDESFFYKESKLKDQIVLHMTAGFLKGDMDTLTKKNVHVSVPFVIGRNGTIYNLFNSWYWSYHLGRRAIGGNKTRSSRTIAIEVSNIGPLKLRRGRLYNIYGGIYCDEDERQFYTRASYRGFDFYATATTAQYGSLRTLLRYLTARYGIPRKFLPESRRFEAGDFVKTFRGIVSHANYRRDKFDIGPFFDWSKIVGARNVLKV